MWYGKFIFIFQDIFCDYLKLTLMDMEHSILFLWIQCITTNSIMKLDEYMSSYNFVFGSFFKCTFILYLFLALYHFGRTFDKCKAMFIICVTTLAYTLDIISVHLEHSTYGVNIKHFMNGLC